MPTAARFGRALPPYGRGIGVVEPTSFFADLRRRNLTIRLRLVEQRRTQSAKGRASLPAVNVRLLHGPIGHGGEELRVAVLQQHRRADASRAVVHRGDRRGDSAPLRGGGRGEWPGPPAPVGGVGPPGTPTPTH